MAGSEEERSGRVREKAVRVANCAAALRSWERQLEVHFWEFCRLVTIFSKLFFANEHPLLAPKVIATFVRDVLTMLR